MVDDCRPQAISVAHNTPYPLEWYSVIPNTAQEIIDKIVALKCAHQRKVRAA